MDITKSRAVLDPSDIPYDVTFIIEDCGSKVRAHKLIMAMGSPMCKKQFYGELKETKDEILIKNTTRRAFAAMVDTFYGKEIQWLTFSAKEIFEIADMAEKYQVEAMKKDVEEAFKEFPINEDDVVEIASIAEAYYEFETPSQILLRTCAKFLTSILKGQNEFVAFSAKYSETGYAELVLKLFALMAEVIPPLPSCCGLSTCRRGKPMVGPDDFVEGETVKVNPEGSDPKLKARMKDIELLTVEDVYGSHLNFEEVVDSYEVAYKGCANFLFCKC